MNIENFSGRIIAPGDADYDTARHGWNAMIDRKPALIAECSSVEDVVAAVKHAAANSLTAVARCGGHSVSGASMPEGGMVIDLGGLNQVEVDTVARIAHVGGGTLLGELDAATQAHGLAVTAGVDPSTGAGGLTLGGGIGFLARKLGLTIDNLEGVQIVLADGSVVEANENSYPDLFWALRGGGGQFGVVTRFDYRLTPIGPEIVTAWAFYPLEKAHDVVRYIRDFMHDASDDVGMVPVFTRVPSADPFPADWHGEKCLAVVGFHVGEEEAAKAELQPLLELGDLVFGFNMTQPYVEFQKSFAEANPHGNRFYWKSIFVDDLSDELVDIMLDGIRTIPGEYTSIFIETLGGAAGRIGVTDTAFSNRSARYNLGIAGGWIDPSMDEEGIAASRACYEKLKPFSDGTVYLNYLDRDEVERTKAGFGPNYERLCAVKAEYDPANLFGGALGGAG
jgi:FAD/FMN-containing dehydrogenase